MIAAPGMPAGWRQADWRFLLPEPPQGIFQHLVVLGGPPELARDLVDRNIAHRVSRQSRGSEGADGLIVFRDAAEPMADAARTLLPGAPFYWEVDRRTARHAAWSPARVRRRLDSVGLSPAALHWVLPNFERAMCCCPLGAPGALRWCLTALYPATSLTRRVIRTGAGLILGRRQGRTAPPGICYVVTGYAGGGMPAGTDEPIVMLTRGRDDFTRVVLLPFAPAGAAPSAVLKIGRFPERNAATEAEQRVLGAVRAALPEGLRQSVPEALGITRRGPLIVGRESCVSGRLLSTSPSMRDSVRDLELVTEWLAEFHARAPVSSECWGEREIHRWIGAPLESYERTLNVTTAESALFAAIRARASELGGVRVPIVWEHYDLGPWNIYRDGDRICVVDWENSTPKLPLSDLLYFVTYWSAAARRRRGAGEEFQNFERVFCHREATDRITAAAHRAIDRYMTRIGLDPRLYPLLLVRLWVLHATGLVARRSVAGTTLEPRADNPFVRFIEILARGGDLFLAGVL